MHRWKLGATIAAVAVLAAACYVPLDYDNDGKADVAWVLENGDWIRNGSATPIFSPGVTIGPSASTVPTYAVPGDYDGNHVWEPAVETAGGTWITGGGRGTFSFPAPPNTTEVPGPNTQTPSLVPVPADYDGDGKTDAAWYRESDATWWIDGQPGPIQFGIPWTNTPLRPGYDVPVPADYDGDGRADLAVYNPDHARFTVQGQNPVQVGFPFGVPAVADYNGDGKADPAVVNKITSNPGDPTLGPPAFELADGSVVPIGANVGDGLFLPVPANYDGAAGDEPATAGNPFTTNSTWSVWIAGQPTVTLPTNSFPVANAADVISALRIEFDLRCAFDPFNQFPPCVST